MRRMDMLRETWVVRFPFDEWTLHVTKLLCSIMRGRGALTEQMFVCNSFFYTERRCPKYWAPPFLLTILYHLAITLLRSKKATRRKSLHRRLQEVPSDGKMTHVLRPDYTPLPYVSSGSIRYLWTTDLLKQKISTRQAAPFYDIIINSPLGRGVRTFF